MAVVHQTPKHRPIDKQDKIVMKAAAFVAVVFAFLVHFNYL